MNTGTNEPEQLKANGLAHFRNGQFDEAKEFYVSASRLSPEDAEVWHMLSAINGMLGHFVESEACARNVIKILPETGPAYINLGAALLAQDKVDEAQAAFETAIQINPANPEAFNNAGNVFIRKEEYLGAVDYYKKAIQLKSDYSEAHNNLGNAYLHLQRSNDALRCLQTALQINPNYPDALFNYGKTLQTLGQRHKSLDAYNQALRLRPDHTDAMFGIGDLLCEQGDFEQASKCYEHLLSSDPNNARILGALAGIKKDSRQLDKAIELYERAITIDPDNAGLYSNYLLSLNYLDIPHNYDVGAIHRIWGEHIKKKYSPSYTFPKSRKHKKLTIGYISHDFRTHSVSYFLEPIIINHNHEEYTIICYANMAKHLEDDTTARIRAKVDIWRDIGEFSDTMVADLIFDDKVDILIDLSGHTAWNRLPVFALRPAPMQISYLGYPNTTGLDAMDYRITDAIADPPGTCKDNYSERLLYLPNGFLTYMPHTSAPIPAQPPCIANQAITFGSFNALPKIGQATITLWCKLLRTIPRSRLLLKNNSFISKFTQETLLAEFKQRGIESDRILLQPPSASIPDHLAFYNRLDIALDTFPYNGTTTTCEALWMGVPVVTLSGSSHAGRVSQSLLHQLKLDWLVADTPGAYIEIAEKLAGNASQLKELRKNMRQLFAASSLGKHREFTKDLEDCIKTTWNSHYKSPNT